MKTTKKILSALCALSMLLLVTPAAFAAENGTLGTDAAEISEESSQYTTDMSLDEIMDALLEEYDTDSEHVFAGYLNLVTGEEWYLNADDEVTAASMYKVPLTMRIAEMLDTGEFDWESRYPNISYDYVLKEVLIESSNEWAQFLCGIIGNYAEYRRETAPFLGISEEEIDSTYLVYNYISPRQMIHCLKLLYDEQERFPNIIETMQQAKPDRYFKYKESRFDIAHKFGYVMADDLTPSTYMNDCGIAFTDEPIAIVMFTKSVYRAEELLTAYCTAMCEYTQYHAAQRREEAAQEEAKQQAELEAEEAAAVAASPETPADSAAEGADAKSDRATVYTAIIAIAVLAVFVIIAVKKRKEKVSDSSN